MSICSKLCSSALIQTSVRQRRETVEHPFGTMKAGMGRPTSCPNAPAFFGAPLSYRDLTA
jgi:hypothetical protein